MLPKYVSAIGGLQIGIHKLSMFVNLTATNEGQPKNCYSSV